MAGPNLEVFKFAVYVFFPVLVFLHYGDPEWYRTNVIPVRTSIPSTDLASYEPGSRLLSTKSEYSPPRRGRHVVTIFQLTTGPYAKSLSALRQKKQPDVHSASKRPQGALRQARGLGGWCSSGGSPRYVPNLTHTPERLRD
ncbi:hypothetical protein BJV78DRAFT_1179907 [Lactifluus subvellereus]|nr:hypothetical protein BJV78DRAFT_1179907 [Lactifluus subvellereus]